MKLNRIVLCFSCLALLLASCNGNGPSQNRKKPQNGETPKEEVAKLKSIKVGTFELKKEMLEKALTKEGFSYEFDKDFPQKCTIVATGDDGAKAVFKKGSENITLTDSAQEIQIEAQKDKKKSSLYTLKLKKAKDNGTTPDADAIVLKSISLNGTALTDDELKAASKKDGVEKVFEKTVKDVKITYTADAGITADINPASPVTLQEDDIEVTITAKKGEKTGVVYKLILVKESDEVKLKSISLNGEKLSNEDFKKAASDEGFEKTFGKDVEKV